MVILGALLYLAISFSKSYLFELKFSLRSKSMEDHMKESFSFRTPKGSDLDQPIPKESAEEKSLEATFARLTAVSFERSLRKLILNYRKEESGKSGQNAPESLVA